MIKKIKSFISAWNQPDGRVIMTIFYMFKKLEKKLHLEDIKTQDI